METTTDDDQEPEWRKKQKEYEIKKARAKALKLKLTCSICSKKAKLNCPCGTTQYCSTDCQRIDWRDRGHRKACKKIRDERAAEAARAEAPTPPPPEEVFYGPAPRSHADEVRARIAAEHEAARARREANPEREPVSARDGPRCPICLEDWNPNVQDIFQACCARRICLSCEQRFGPKGDPCPLCRMPQPNMEEQLARIRRHAENDVPEAVNHLAGQYRDGNLGLAKNPKKAAKIYKRAVECGDVQAMVSLGDLYFRGDGVKQSRGKAAQLFRMASERGNAKGSYNAAALAENDGRMDEAHRYYTLSAERNFAEAQFLLSEAYGCEIRGAEYDPDESHRWLLRAVANGHEQAKTALELKARAGL